MADSQRSSGLVERDVDQAITALKKGSYLLKYGRRGKPKFCPFQLSSDESTLVWYSGKEEKHLKLNQVSKIIPGQRTAIFQRYPRPEKEYQSFSLIYSDRSLDLICKDKDEAEVWFVGLKALITRGKYQSKWRIDTRSESVSSESPRIHTQRISPQFDQGFADDQGIQVPVESTTQNRFGRVISEILSQPTTAKNQIQAESVVNPFSSLNAGCIDNPNARTSASDTVRVSLSSAVSSSSQGSFHEDFDALGDVFIWGEGIGDGILGGGVHKIGKSSKTKVDALLPKALESTVVLDVSSIACGSRHAVLVTRQGEIFSWGEDSGGRLGHGIESDVPHPKLIGALSGMSVELVACGEYHTCAVTLSGELYTWGDGTHNSGLLGHESEASHWIPKKVSGDMDGIHVSYISCGPWHTSAVTSAGQLFTFGDGTFGALGHGDRRSTIVPREVDALRGLRTTRVACGVWHTAAVVEVTPESSREGLSESHSAGQLFTWGDGDEGRLGHGDKEPRLVPECVAALLDKNICQVACGNNLTVALTAAGQVYTMGSTAYGQLGNPMANGKVPALVEGKIADNFVEEIACGSFHVAVLTSKTEVYTWGKGKNGQLGHGDNEDRHKPTLVHFLKEKQVKTVVCGSNVTAVICLHKWVSSTDHSVCSGCRNPFGFRRKRHNCYNCGLVFCKWCSSKKCLKAALAPNMNKPYRVCDECFNKLKKAAESSTVVRIPKPRTGEPKTRTGDVHHKTNETANRGVQGPILLTHITRLKSAGISSQAESWHPKQDIKQAFDNGRVFPASIGNFQLGGSYSLKVSTFLDGAKKKTITNSTPNLKISSHAASLSGMARPASSPELTRNDSKQKRDNASEEIAMLRAQVEDLTVKAQHLEAELERKSRHLKEVTAIASNEAEKCKSAREVIKSLTAQLTEMSERLPEEQRAIAKDSSLVQNFSSSESHSANAVSREVESNGNSTDNRMLSYGTKAQNEKPLCTIQAEPGVYITLSSTPGGQNELKRVRFSRRQFTEQQAEKWWAEHGAKVCEQHNIQSTE